MEIKIEIDKNLADHFFKIDCHAEQSHTGWDYHKAKDVSTSKAHGYEEMIIVCGKILMNEKLQPIEGDVCEFGCYTGISSAKLSIITDILKKPLYLFDSFEGLPEIDENASDLAKSVYEKGQYCCSIDAVKKNIEMYGKPQDVKYVKGFFSYSLKTFKDTSKIAYAFIDVDLCKSLEECLDFVLPKLQVGGILFSHEAKDPDYPPVFKAYGLLDSEKFEAVGADGTGIWNTNICMFRKLQ